MIPKGVRRVAGGALFLLGAGSGSWASRALADEATTKVTVIRPTGGDVVLVEIATRAWAELNAGGVAATLVDCAAEGDACQTEAPPPRGNAITLRTFRRDDETITEAALTPDGRDRPTVRRSLTVSDEAAADPKVTAIRAVELVNAMLLQVDSAAAESAEAWRRAAVADAELPGQHVKNDERDDAGPVLDGRALWSAGAGGSMLKSADGLGAAFGFAIRAGRTLHDRIGLSALFAETWSRAATATLHGNLSTTQALFALEATCRLYRNARFASHVALGGGGYHVDAVWSEPFSQVGGLPGGSSALWALLFSGGAGAELALGPEMSLFLEARAIWASPTPVFYSAAGTRLKMADPSLSMSLGLQRAF